MTDLTPRNFFPYPSEREQPFWDVFKAGAVAADASVFANADNGNLQFMGGGIFSWDAGTDLLFWTDEIQVSGFHTPFRATIPLGSITIQENEVVFFAMPRQLQQNAAVDLFRSSRIFAEGTRLNDLRLFVIRDGDTVYFMNGLSLQDGDTGVLFGQGLLPLQSVLPHQHEPAWLYIAPSVGITLLTPLPVIVQPDLFQVQVFKNGQLLVEESPPGPAPPITEDYRIDLSTGAITLLVPTTVTPSPDKFVVFRETRDATVVVTGHKHEIKLILKPTPGTTALSVLATAPFLLRVDVFKNGQLLVEGASDDYTVDLFTGVVTLLVPSVFGDKFEIHRYLALP